MGDEAKKLWCDGPYELISADKTGFKVSRGNQDISDQPPRVV